MLADVDHRQSPSPWPPPVPWPPLLQGHFAEWQMGVVSWSCFRVKMYLRQCLAMAIGGCFEEWQIQVISFMAGRISSPAVATHNGILQVWAGPWAQCRAV